MDAAAPLSGVSGTALGVARVRAYESQRPGRLFDDPYAAAFVAAAGEAPRPGPRAGPPDPVAVALARQVIVRTRFFDDHLLGACAAGCRQVVLLAAGLDARAFRLAWPDGTRLFEMDLAPVFAFKEPVLEGRGARPGCARTVVPVDLTGDWTDRLVGAGFDPAAPTAWLAEGFLMYLTGDQATHVAETVTRLSAAGSRIAAERGRAAGFRAAALTSARAADMAAMWQAGLEPDAATWLDSHGWRAQVHDAALLAESYGRPAPEIAANAFVTAVRV